MKHNCPQRMDGRKLLRSVAPRTAHAVFFDPQYRAGLDQLAYGNEGARQKGRAKLAQMPDKMIAEFCHLAERTLTRSGHLFLWCDKFTVGESHWRLWINAPTALKLVDMVTWNKGRIGMGKRTRYCSEFLMIFQKEPIRAKGIWLDHGIRDCWTEYADRSVHPHCKPIQLQERLIRAVVPRGKLVLDPAAGGYSVLAACQESGRDFIGCDIA